MAGKRRLTAAVPIPQIFRQWNKVGLNRVTRHIAPWMPGLGLVVHRGRRSGNVYQTPVNVFAAEDGYVLALTYGLDTDWVKNVLAAGGCELRTRGRVVHLTAPLQTGTIALAILLAIAGGLIAGAFGAWRAARMRPAAALRTLA